MTRPRSRIGSELLLIGLILGCLVGTWFLIVSMHRRAERHRKAVARPAAIVVKAPEPAPPAPPAAPPPPAPEPEPAEPDPPPALVEDPTRPVLARLGAEEAEQMLEARAADRKAEALERSRQAAVDESTRWRRREQVIRSQIDRLAERAQSLEQDADALARDRDVLAHERDATKAALAKASTRSSFAVLPNRSPNGTWRRPIVIECRNGTATLQPHGPTFSLLDLSGLLSARSSPIVIAVVRELVRIQGLSAPDGSAAVPYIFFVVRPDGIRPYYEARARLEPLGMAFGYELVDQDMEIDFPDLDHPGEWDGSAPLPAFPVASLGDEPNPARPGGGGRPDGQKHSVDDFRWPTAPPGGVPGSEGAEPFSRRGSGGGGMPPGDRHAGGMGLDPYVPRGFGPGGPPAPSPIRGGKGTIPRLATAGSEGRAPHAPHRRGRRACCRPWAAPARPRRAPPGMLPPAAGSGGVADGSDAATQDPGSERAPWTNAGAGGTFSASGPPTPGTDRLPPGLAAPGRPGGQGGVPAGSVPPLAAELSRLDGSSILGRRAGESAGAPRTNLKPGEPGAPPEDGAYPSGSAGRGDAAPGTTTAGASGSNPRSGSPNASGLAMGGDPAGNVGAGSSSGQPQAGGQQLQGEESLIPRRKGPLKIEVPMEIVVACGPTGLTIHPGGYQLTARTLKSKEGTLAKSLRTIVHLRQQVDPMIRPRPSIRFLVEPGGGESYREARRQTVLSGLDWPTVLQISDTRVLDFLPKERF